MENVAPFDDPFGQSITRPILRLAKRAIALRAKRYSLRTHLCALALVVLAPIFFAGWWYTAHTAASARAAIESIAEQTSRGITALIDRDLQNAKNILTSLATSHHLRTDNLELFYRDASEVTRELGTPIVLREPGRDEQLVNTDVPWGIAARQPTLAPKRVEAEQQVLRTSKPAVSDTFYSNRTKGHLISVAVPVIRDGIVKYTLWIGIPTKQFAEIVQSTQLPAEWVARIVDRDGVIVARSDKHDQFTGTRVHNRTDDLLAKDIGVQRGVNREGTLIQWSYRRSEVSGWLTAVGIPETVLAVPFNRALAIYSGVSGLLLIIVLTSAYLVGGRISQRFGTLGVDRKPSREEFRILFESAPHGVLVVDSNGCIVLANERLERKFGYEPGELIGQSSTILFSMNAGDVQPDAIDRKPNSNEMRGLRKCGSVFPIEVHLNPIMTNSGQFMIATVINITARKRAEGELHSSLAESHALRRRLMQAQEDERLRLAHELHDQTGQSLAAVMLGMRTLEALVDERGRDHLVLMSKQMEEMAKTLHHVAWELRPASLDELGLKNALANYLCDWSTKFGITIDFQCSEADVDDLSDEVRTVIYRVVQEALTNIAKHAQTAGTVSVIVNRFDTMLQLTVEDDGDGFDAPSLSLFSDRRQAPALGLVGMRERLTLIGGKLEVESSVGSGTTICARIPLEKERLVA